MNQTELKAHEVERKPRPICYGMAGCGPECRLQHACAICCTFDHITEDCPEFEESL